jgi:hypothetical protein
MGNQKPLFNSIFDLQHELIQGGRTVVDCTPGQLALLLAFGVRRKGGRAAVIRRNNGAESVEFFTSRANCGGFAPANAVARVEAYTKERMIGGAPCFG